jgi:hypothetical protein
MSHMRIVRSPGREDLAQRAPGCSIDTARLNFVRQNSISIPFLSAVERSAAAAAMTLVFEPAVSPASGQRGGE